MRRYGWRAYALPLLCAITVVALVDISPSSPTVGRPAAHRPPATAHGPNVGAEPGNSSAAATARSTPSGVTIEGLTSGDGHFGVASTPAPVVIHRGGDGVTCAGNSYRQLVLVSIGRQHLWACQGGKQVESTPVTTGATVDHDQTPLGSWRVQAKQRDRYLVGPGYRDYVHYWVPFNGDFGLHDASWQKMPFGSMGYQRSGSHGCVHVPTATMAWLYRWSSVGQTVVTVEA